MWKKDASSSNDRGGRPSFGDRGGRPSFGDRGGRPSFGGDRGGRSFGGDRGGRPSFGGDRGGRPSFGDRGDRPRFSRDSRGGDARKPSHEVKLLLNEKVKAPKYMSQEATGADVFYSGNTLKIAAGAIVTIDTGIIVSELPERLECQVRGRSSFSSKGLLILDPTSFGLDMKDSYLVLTVINLSKEEIIIENGQAVAQLVFSFIQKVQINKTDELNSTERNENGFGSTDNLKKNEEEA